MDNLDASVFCGGQSLLVWEHKQESHQILSDTCQFVLSRRYHIFAALRWFLVVSCLELLNSSFQL